MLLSLAGSFLLLTKLHRQLSHMIEGRIYQKCTRNWPSGLQAKYRASSKEMILHVASFGLLGITIGLRVYAEQQLALSLIIGALALVVFSLMVKEIWRNFRIEEARNKSVFEGQRRR